MYVSGWRECKVQQSFVSSRTRSLRWRSNCAWETDQQHGFFQYIKSMQLEDTKKAESQFIHP